ncbi:MAG: aminotransferase class IV [Gaiellaceae bacterium]
MTLLALAVGGRGLVDPSEPVLHADDEAFLRGRAAFETIRVYDGRPFRLEDHLERLAASAERLGLPPVELVAFRGLVREVVEASGEGAAILRLYVTPGREGAGYPTALAMVSTLPPDLEERRARGQRMITIQLGIEPAVRADAPWLLGGVKSTSYAVNMAAEAEARRRNADDAVFLANGRIVLEGPVTNVWWRNGEELFTPSLELGILAGVTRATLLTCAAELGYAVTEGVFPVEDLAGAEEAFTSSSIREVMPAIELDERPIGNGRPGPATTRLQAALRQAAGA